MITEAEIQKLIENVQNVKLDSLIKTANILRPQSNLLPEIEVNFLKAVENEIKRRNK